MDAGQTPGEALTFLLTDIEGSTRLWERYPDAMRAALVLHDALLQRALGRYGGRVYKTVGDAFHAVFAQPGAALAAAYAVQKDLLAARWPGTGPLRVRMALAHGPAELRHGDYAGPALAQAAGLLAAGHGGQILLAAPVVDAAGGYLPGGATLLDLGAHRLGDAPEPVAVRQLVMPGLPADFPPLRVSARRAYVLPRVPGPPAGREAERAALGALLREPATAVVTLTGPGGIGKTRLALQAAHDLDASFESGACFVDLDGVTDAEVAAANVARALDVAEQNASVENFLQSRELLLVLDNVDPAGGVAALAARLSAAAPRLKLLITSRTALAIPGEREFPVAPLGVPPARQWAGGALAELARYPAVELFCECARAVRPDFRLDAGNAAAVAAICAQLDGVPLAIELAAARVRLLSPQAIRERLSDLQALLGAGPEDRPPRQETMRQALAWGWDLLDPAERLLFARLAVFAGSFGAAAAADVGGALPGGAAPAEVLGSLADRRFVRRESAAGGGERYRLPALIREYAFERLADSGERAAVERRHAAYYAALAENAAPRLEGGEQALWLERLERERDDLRAALQWALEQGEAVTALRLAGALWWFWYLRGHYAEGRRALEAALGAGAGAPPAVRLRVLLGAGVLALLQCDYAVAANRLATALALARDLADERGTVTALQFSGSVAREQGQYERAIARAEEALALARERGDARGAGRSQNSIAMAAWLQGDLARANAAAAEALVLARETGEQELVVWALLNLGAAAVHGGDPDEAQARLRESLAAAREVGFQEGIAWSLDLLGTLARRSGALATARAELAESLTIHWTLGDRWRAASVLEGLAIAAVEEGRAARGARLLAAAAALRAAIGAPVPPIEAPDVEDAQALADEDLGAEAAAARAAGRALAAEQAVAEALEDR